MWHSVSIFADDLTGLTETVQAFAQPLHQQALGYATIVHPLPLKAENLLCPPFSVTAFNTNHRAYTIEAVKRHALQWTSQLSSSTLKDTFYYQKMDSTLRGWWAEEAQQAITVQAVSLVWCCPAYPQHGRTTLNGYHFLDNIPVHQTAMAKDPTHPISTHELATYVAKAGVEPTQILTITASEIDRLSVVAWVERLQTLFQQKQITWLLQDATTPQQLEKMAKVVHQLQCNKALPNTLFVGSGGWAGALARCETTAFIVNPTGVKAVTKEPSTATTLPTPVVLPRHPTLLVSGSVNPTTLAQLAYLKQCPPASARWVSVVHPHGKVKSVETLLAACQTLAPHETLILTTCTSPNDRSFHAAEQASIQATLSAVLSQLFQTMAFDKVICCGGDTSLLTLQAANAPLLHWLPQQENTHFPQLHSASGCTWVFKSGNMGNKTILSH
jgi:uncharacterized protein YgbK (DUF1537 family)